jgi:hypothetical protein
MNFQLTPLSKIFPQPCMFLPLLCLGTILALTCPASSTELLSAPLVWVRRGGLVPPLQPLYDGPSAVLCRGPCSFTIRVGSQEEVVAVSCLKACTAVDATSGIPCCRGRLPGSRPGSLAATKWVSFSDPLVSSPFPSLTPPPDGPGTIFLPGEEGSAAPSQPPQTRYRPVSGHCPRGWTSDLFSFQLRPELTSTGLNLMTTAGQRRSICRLLRCFKFMMIKIKLCEISYFFNFAKFC